VAAGLCFGALGTDTAASVRHPAAYCGVVGLKPTYGRVSTRGVIPLSWSLDHIGPLCRSATDAALVLETIAGYDPLEPLSVDRPTERFSSAMQARTAPLRIGVVRQPYFRELDPDIEAAVSAAIQVLARITAGVRDVELPYSNVLLTIASAEAYAFHKPWFTWTPELYQDMTRRRLEQAATISAADYVSARREMERLRWQADSAFSGVELLVTPTTAIAPISIERLWITCRRTLPSFGTHVRCAGTTAISVLMVSPRHAHRPQIAGPVRRVASTRAGAYQQAPIGTRARTCA
jgi:aspartyl-tRNA(Asn)/glutamyl-tRNA(Gln) amidotransferase subunit A